MKTIICIVGPSGSGKTTICRHLENEYHIPTVVSFTTRPMREDEGYGVDHHFVKPEQKPAQEDMLAYTKFGNYEYWVHKNQIDEIDSSIFTYVIDEDGVRFLMDRYSKRYNIVSIQITRDNIQVDDARKQRDAARKSLAHYDFTFENNGTIDQICKEIAFIATQIALKAEKSPYCDANSD